MVRDLCKKRKLMYFGHLKRSEGQLHGKGHLGGIDRWEKRMSNTEMAVHGKGQLGSFSTCPLKQKLEDMQPAEFVSAVLSRMQGCIGIIEAVRIEVVEPLAMGSH